MHRLFAVLAIALCLFLAPSPLLAQDHLVLFAGYSYLRPPVTVTENSCPPGLIACPAQPIFVLTTTNHQNLNGWELSGTYRFLPFLGVAVDFSAHYASALPNSTSNVHQYFGLVGPEVSLPARVSPFAHVLFGGAHQSVSSGTVNAVPLLGVLPNTIHSFATAVGGGIDVRVARRIWIRPIQIDYLLTRLNNATQNQPRLSAGLVLHF